MDNLDHMNPKINILLTHLYENAVVISASRQSWEVEDPTDRENPEYCLYRAPKLRIGHLTERDTFLVTKHVVDNAF